MFRFLLFPFMMMTCCFMGCSPDDNIKTPQDDTIEHSVEKPRNNFVGFKEKNQGISIRIKEASSPIKDFLLISLDGEDYCISLTQTGELVLEAKETSMIVIQNLRLLWGEISSYATRFALLQSKDGYVYNINVTMSDFNKSLMRCGSYAVGIAKYKGNLDVYRENLDSYIPKEGSKEQEKVFHALFTPPPEDADGVFSYVTDSSRNDGLIMIPNLSVGDLRERFEMFVKFDELEYAWRIVPIGGVIQYSIAV